MQSLKYLLKNLLRTFGYDLSSYPGNTGRLDYHLIKLFNLLNINCVFDIGACVGGYGAFLRNIGYKGVIISFEPIVENFKVLFKVSAKDPNWHVHCLALGNEDCTMPINVTKAGDFSSFLSPNNYCWIRFESGTVIDRVEEVNVKRLDSVFEDCITTIKDARVFLKIDTQGYDLKVLEGAKNSLNNILALQSEVSVKPIYENTIGYLEAIHIMNHMGFELTGLFPLTRDRLLQVIEFDCVMVKTS